MTLEIDEKIFSEPSYFDDARQQRVNNLMVAFVRTIQESDETDGEIVFSALCALLTSHIIGQARDDPALQRAWIKTFADYIEMSLKYNGMNPEEGA